MLLVLPGCICAASSRARDHCPSQQSTHRTASNMMVVGTVGGLLFVAFSVFCAASDFRYWIRERENPKMHELLQHKMTRCTKHQSRRYTGAETRVEGSKVGLLREAAHLLLTIQKQSRWQRGDALHRWTTAQERPRK